MSRASTKWRVVVCASSTCLQVRCQAFEIIDAVSKGVLDGGHHVSAYWYGRTRVLRSSARASERAPRDRLTWIYKGGGQELWNKLTAKLA